MEKSGQSSCRRAKRSWLVKFAGESGSDSTEIANWGLRYICLRVDVSYSGTSPYDHPVYKTTSLLRPYSFKPNVKTIDSVNYFEDPVNATTSLLRPGFYGPTVVALTGFHCISFACNKGNRRRLHAGNATSVEKHCTKTTTVSSGDIHAHPQAVIPSFWSNRGHVTRK